jgi:hypothetical protein
MTNIPATHDPRTDAQILADKDKNKDLERGTVRDANGVPRDMRQFPAAPVESYSQYLARVSGLTDFTPLTEAQWRKETGQKTAEETILADLGITPRPIVEVKVPLDTPVLDGTIPTIPLTKELDIAEYFPKELVERATVPDVVLREMNSKCPVPSRMQGDIGVMPTVPASNITEVIAEEPYPSYDPSTELADSIVAAEAEARHTAAHPPAVDSVKLEIDPIEEV